MEPVETRARARAAAETAAVSILSGVLATRPASTDDPAAPGRWPAHTVFGPADVVVAGVSLVELSRWSGSPSVHTAAASDPAAAGGASPSEVCAVVVATVVDVACADRIHLDLDVDLRHCGAVVEEARLIGRRSTAPRVATWPIPGADPVVLPEDVRPGDLVAVPCTGPVALRDVRPAGTPLPEGRCAR